MADLFPAFQIAKYFGNETTIGPGGKLAEEYASPNGGAKYGYYDGEGFVFDARFYMDFFQWGAFEYTPTGNEWLNSGPRSIVCARNLGQLKSLIVYAKGDYVNRDMSTTLDLTVNGTGYGSVDTLAATDSEPIAQLSIAVYNNSITPDYLYVQSDSSDTGNHNFLLAAANGSEWSADNTITSPGQVGKYIVTVLDPIPTAGMCIWVGHRNNSNGPRITIVGVEVNDTLFGVDENGNPASERPSYGTDPTGDLWWRELQLCIQSGVAGSTGVDSLPYSEPRGTFIEGYRKGFYDTDLHSEWDGVGQFTNSDLYASYFGLRDNYATGIFLGLINALDEGGSPYSPPANIKLAGANDGEDYGIWDGRWAGFAAGRPMTRTLVADIEDSATAFQDPNPYATNDDFGVGWVDGYLGAYTGSLDGQIAAGGTYDETTGQVGSTEYNSAYVAGYRAGWIDNNGNFGDIPEG